MEGNQYCPWSILVSPPPAWVHSTRTRAIRSFIALAWGGDLVYNEALSSGEPKPIISNVARGPKARGQHWKLLAVRKWLCNTEKGFTSLKINTLEEPQQMCIIHIGHLCIWSQFGLPQGMRSNCNTNYTLHFNSSSERYFQRSTFIYCQLSNANLSSHSTFSFPLVLAQYSWFLESAAVMVVFIFTCCMTSATGKLVQKQPSPAHFAI